MDNVHYEKDLGVATITRDDAEAFCKKYHPAMYDEFVRANQSAPYPVCIDFEDLLSGLEKLPSYEALANVIRTGTISSPEEKVFLASFVQLQQLRSHSIMSAMLEWSEMLGAPKFEYFVTMKRLLGDPNYLLRTMGALAVAKWILYRTETDLFPLPDSAVLYRPESIMVALSPRLLLEIKQHQITSGRDWEIRDQVKPSKVREYRRRAIGNTFREIIFSNKRTLEVWRSTPEFGARVRLIRDMKSYNAMVANEMNHELWKINAFGNQ